MPGNKDLRLSGLLALLLVGFSFNLSSQCPQSLGCNDDIQISLDYECFAIITPELVLEDERSGCDYVVTILTANDVVIDQTTYDMMGNPQHPVIDGSFIGPKYKASVSFVDDNNTVISCWGWFSVEDKLPPEVTCLDDITVDCSEDLDDLFTSMGLITYCSDPNPMDRDANPNTITILLNPLSGSGSTSPWELIDFIDINVPLNPFTGSGTGTLVTDGGSYDFEEDPVDNSIYRGEISGVQATEDNLSPTISLVINDTPANQAAIFQGICVDINTVSFFKYQQQDNCDPNVEVIINKDQIESLECTTGDYTARRDIEFYTRDHVGLSAEVCAFSIFFEKKSIAEMSFPPNVFYDCDDPQINNNGELDLSHEVTGQPNIDGYPLTDANNLCRINVTFSDDTFNVCGFNTIKILRRWTALDWCEGEYAQSYQTIKVVDEDGPELECPDDGLVFETYYDCEASVIFRPFDEDDITGLKSVFDCAELDAKVFFLRDDQFNPLLSLDDQVFTMAVEISSNVFRADGLQNGLNYIKYVISDACGNESECIFEILVVDNAPPFAVCDQFTAVSLADNGWGRLYAQAVDDGSYDECGGPVILEIKRDSSVCEDLPEYEPDDTVYGPYVQFCCQEAGQTLPVTMRVTDQSGRSNTCRVMVIVQDKTGIDLESCPDQLIFNLECADVDQIDTSITGKPIINGDCGIGIIRFEDSGTVNDICGNGTIIRKWFVELPDNTIELKSCEQLFNFTSDVVLDHDSFDWPADRADATCENYTTDLGDAVLYNGVPANEAPVCAHLSYTYKDRVFENVEGYCLKIIRTWTVIDFCVYDASENPTEGIWKETQVIKVKSNEGPELSECPEDMTLDAVANCENIININPPKAFDNCDKSFLHPAQLNYVIRRNNVIVGSGSGPIVNDTLAAGTYIISWTAESICSAISSCSHQIVIRDNKAPVPYCRSGITTALTPPANQGTEPFIEIWAIDFDLGSSDNCDPDVELSFDKDDLDLKSLRFTCEDLGPNEITVWVTDDMGNQDFCTTILNIQENGNICPDTSGMMIAGHVETEFHQMLENVEVSLQSMIDSGMKYDNTNINGEFAFHTSDDYLDFQLKAVSARDYLNGVSTLDLILIQRHILGLQSLDSPYQLIAADINSNEEISALDLIELRKLILGIYDELPHNDSWRFVDKSFQFADDKNPWPFKEYIDLYDVKKDMMDNDFIAVKVGDINSSFQSYSDDEGDSSKKLNKELIISHDALELGNDGEYLIPFYFREDIEFMGLQIFMNFDDDLEVIAVESGRLLFDDSNYHIGKNAISFVWHDDRAVTSNSGDALFYLTVRNSDKSLDAEEFSIGDIRLSSEIYTRDLEIRPLALERRESNHQNKLYQNVPNPFSSITNIEFELAHDSEVRLNIFDTNGRLVRMITGNYNAGMNSILLRRDELKGNGIYYYQLESELFSATRKMIFIE